MTKWSFSFSCTRLVNGLLFILIIILIVSCASVNKIIPDKNAVIYIEKYSGFDESSNIKAITKLSKKIKRDSLNADALNARGFCYLRLNRFPDALADYNKSIQISPSASKFINRSIINRKLGNYKEAFTDLRSATELDSSNFSIDFNYGMIYMDIKDYERAIQYFLKSNQNETIRFTALYNIGKCYRYLNDFGKAIEYYNDANAIISNVAPLYDNLGTAYMLSDNYEKGVENYTKAIELQPYFYSPYYNRGCAYFNAMKFKEAISDFEKAITLTKDVKQLVVIYCNLSRLMFLTENYSEGISYANKVLYYKGSIDLEQFYYIAMYNMAICNLKLSELDTAYTLYKDCFKDDTLSKYPEIFDEVCDDLVEHYKKGLNQMFVKDILLNVVKITEEDFNNRIENNN